MYINFHIKCISFCFVVVLALRMMLLTEVKDTERNTVGIQKYYKSVNKVDQTTIRIIQHKQKKILFHS